MNIAFITNRYYPAIGGAETFVKSLAEELTAKGHTITVYCSDFDEWYGYEKLPAEVTTIQKITVKRLKSIRLFGRDALTIISPLFSLASELNSFDLIQTFAYGYSTSWIPGLLRLMNKINVPILFCPQYNSHPSYPNFLTDIFHMTLGRITIEQASAIVLETPSFKNFFFRITSEQNIHIIPSGIATLERASIKVQTKLREQLHLEPNTLVISSVSRLSSTKNINILLKTFARLHQEIKTTHLLIAGDGEEKTNLEHLVKELGKTEAVTFMGMVAEQEKAALFSITDVFVSLSSIESFGLTLIEALEHGIPIVASNIPAYAFILAGTHNFLVNPDDTKEIILGIRSALTKETLIKMENQQVYKDRYALDKIATAYLDLYSEVLKK